MNETTANPADRFLARLYGYRDQDDRASLAKLRRAVADPGADSNVFAIIGRSLPPNLNRRETDAYLLTACLFATHNKAGGDGSIGDAARELRGGLDAGQESLDTRFAALLNSNWEDLSHHLRHLVAHLNSKEVPVNYSRLLFDLLNWNQENRRVQRRWAGDYWQPGTEEGAIASQSINQQQEPQS